MDDKLRKRLQKIEAHIEVVYGAEERYLTLDAAKDHTLAVLMAKVDATLSGSQAAREMHAKASSEWKAFTEALALAEARFHRERHIMDLKLKAYDAEHLSLKVESPVIKRQI